MATDERDTKQDEERQRFSGKELYEMAVFKVSRMSYDELREFVFDLHARAAQEPRPQEEFVEEPKRERTIIMAKKPAPASGCERCPSCGSRENGVRCCMVENCGHDHFDGEFDHRKVVCSDSWHSATGSGKEGETR